MSTATCTLQPTTPEPRHRAAVGIGDVGKDDRHGAIETPQRRHAQSATRKNDVGRRDQLRCTFLLKVRVILAPTNIDLDIAALAPAQLLQTLFECLNSSLTLGIRCGPVHQHADATYTIGLLRTRRERTCDR